MKDLDDILDAHAQPYPDPEPKVEKEDRKVVWPPVAHVGKLGCESPYGRHIHDGTGHCAVCGQFIGIHIKSADPDNDYQPECPCKQCGIGAQMRPPAWQCPSCSPAPDPNRRGSMPAPCTSCGKFTTWFRRTAAREWECGGCGARVEAP